MRTNLPVTQQAFEIPDGATLMSTTDVHSHISYANDAFVAASGFNREQLTGQPHNIVRHPDMPSEAFADMWATLKSGLPWTGLVKNRRSNGDHYWVRANAMPVVREGRTVGYMSVRTKPTREEVAAAQVLYHGFKSGTHSHLAFHQGLVVRTGWRRFTSALQTMPVRWRIRWALLAFAGAAICTGGAAGLAGNALAAFVGGIAAAGLLATWWLEAQVSTPIEHMRDHALRMASGDTSSSLHVNRVDEIGITTRAVGQLGLMFRWIIDDVNSQVLNVQTATAEIAQGNNDLSSRTEQAAASVEETASSMEEMTATVKSNADTVRLATELSGAASQAAARGGQAVADVVATMSGISESSRRIGEIIGVIDGIAFQTNILALNAAVEAARAGEQGRGFAVVAGEVRALAQRSADAAKQIKALIGTSVEQVESGSRLVDDAGKTMQDIVSQVRRVAELIAEIGTATREQSTGITQVGQGIAHLDQVTQQNAALVEQSAAASESLQQQMARLAEAVGVFR